MDLQLLTPIVWERRPLSHTIHQAVSCNQLGIDSAQHFEPRPTRGLLSGTPNRSWPGEQTHRRTHAPVHREPLHCRK